MKKPQRFLSGAFVLGGLLPPVDQYRRSFPCAAARDAEIDFTLIGTTADFIVTIHMESPFSEFTIFILPRLLLFWQRFLLVFICRRRWGDARLYHAFVRLQVIARLL
jgi:hypothetical protein